MDARAVHVLQETPHGGRAGGLANAQRAAVTAAVEDVREDRAARGENGPVAAKDGLVDDLTVRQR